MTPTTEAIIAITLFAGLVWMLWCRWLEVKRQEEERDEND